MFFCFLYDRKHFTFCGHIMLLVCHRCRPSVDTIVSRQKHQIQLTNSSAMLAQRSQTRIQVLGLDCFWGFVALPVSKQEVQRQQKWRFLFDCFYFLSVVFIKIWQLGLLLHMQSMPITTFVSYIHGSGKVHSIQLHVMKYICDLRQVFWLL